MLPAKGYAAFDAHSPLGPFSFERRSPGPRDVQIEILHCGICHSDLHQARNDWKSSTYPMVPGHEIVGRVVAVGREVERFREGDLAGVGVFVDSCRTCPSCLAGEEQYCEKGMTGTYNSRERESGKPVYGGYSDKIVVDEHYALKVSPKLDLAAAAPLLCAGITTYSPLRHWRVGKGMKVGIVGLGGLGHMGVKFAHALGAHVAMVTTSPGKAADALKLGADEVLISTDPDAMARHGRSFDLLLDTIPNGHDLNPYVTLLKRDGTLVLVGALTEWPPLFGGALVSARRSLAGSMIGGIRQTQEMLDFCAEHGIVADIEKIRIQQINDAYTRMLKNDVKYRFVIDMASLKEAA